MSSWYGGGVGTLEKTSMKWFRALAHYTRLPADMGGRSLSSHNLVPTNIFDISTALVPLCTSLAVIRNIPCAYTMNILNNLYSIPRTCAVVQCLACIYLYTYLPYLLILIPTPINCNQMYRNKAGIMNSKIIWS